MSVQDTIQAAQPSDGDRATVRKTVVMDIEGNIVPLGDPTAMHVLVYENEQISAKFAATHEIETQGETVAQE